MSYFDQLIQTLTDTTQPGIVRSSAITRLVAQGDAQSIKFLVAALADSDSLIRREAAKALQNLNATSATEPLLRALQAEAKDLTLWAMLEAISELGTPNDLPVLESLLKVDSMLTRIEVKKSISRIQERHPSGITPTPPEVPEATEPEAAEDTDEALDANESLLHTLFKKPRTTKQKSKTTPNQTSANQTSAQETSPPHSQQPPEADTSSDTTVAETEPDETVNDQQPHVFIKSTPQTPSVKTDDETLEQTDTVDDTQNIHEPADVIDETEAPTEPTETSTHLPDDSDQRTLTDSENVSTSADDMRLIDEADTQSADKSDEVTTDETETSDTESPQQEDDTESPQQEDDTESPQQKDDTESPQQEDDTEIRDLSDAIARSPRLAGSSVSLPVLAPNADTVPYHPKGTAIEPAPIHLFLALLHPSKYLSKQWLSRTRVYLILWTVLIAAVVGFTQHQKHFRAKPTPLSRIGLNPDELPELVKRSLAEGDFHIQEGHYRKAISSYELSRRLSALPLDFYRKLGFAYFMEGQYALSIEAYELFLKAREEHGTPEAFTAEASFTGVQTLTSIGKGTTQDYETYNILGTAYAKLGRVLDAQRAYEEAIRLAPKYGEAYNNLARLYIDNDQHPLTAGLEELKSSPKLRLAETLAYTAVTLNPNVAAYHNTLGRILSKRGQVNKAMKVLERAIDLQRDAVEPHYHLAKVALKANERKKAAEAIRNVFKLKPAFVPLHANQQQ